MEPHLNFVLLGGKGVGKSASGNTILEREAFVSKKSSKSVTQEVAVEYGNIHGLPVTVYDTPGFCGTELSESELQKMINEKVFQKCESGPRVFLLVIKADSFTEEERKTVGKIEEVLGEKRLQKTWILLTRGDELEENNMTVKEFLDESEPLKNLIQKYDQRFIIFNNRRKGHSDQARSLLTKILHRALGLKDGKRLMRLINDQQQTDDSPSTRRIVLLGKTGVGKSAAGNTILGQKEFVSEQSMDSVSRECLEKHATVSGRSVSVVDTPGFFDTSIQHDKLMTEIARSVYLSSPGPHAFLIVFPVNMRFTEQEVKIAELIEIMFGEEVLKYSIILFTHADLLEGESIEKEIKKNTKLRHLVDQCGGRYHLFNNKDQNNREQVNDLLQKIDTMIEQNGGGHYSNEMFEDAHRFRQEEEERRQREEEETERMFKVQRDPEFEKFYKQYEARFQVSAVTVGNLSCAEFGAICGAVLGGVLGIVGGPVLVAIGAGYGAAIGAGYCAGIGAVINAIKKH